jgi:outer membrane protein TolC
LRDADFHKSDLKQLFEQRLAKDRHEWIVHGSLSEGGTIFPMCKEDKTKAVILSLAFLLTAPLVWSQDGFAGMDQSDADDSEMRPAEAAELPFKLDLDGLFARIKSQNLQVLIQEMEVRRALQRSYQARAGLLPQFTIRAEQTRQQLARGPAGEDFALAPFNSFGSRLEASMPLFDTQRYADYRIAQLDYAIAQNNYEVVLQDFLEQAVFIYFGQLRDLRQLEIAEGNLVREQSLLELARQQFEAGAAVKIDVTRAEVRVATQRREVMEAEVTVATSAMDLKVLLDVDPRRPLELDRRFLAGLKPPPDVERYSAQEVLTELRPELRTQRGRLEQAELAAKAARWQRLPSVELFANWGYDSDEVLDGDEGEAWLVGLRLDLPIWEGGRIAAERREADAAVRQSEYAVRDLRNSIERDFRLSIIDMESRFAQIEIAQDEVRLGLEEVSQARERYREGLADNRELIDAQNRLAEAERSELQATYLYGLSRLAFARSIASVERVLD